MLLFFFFVEVVVLHDSMFSILIIKIHLYLCIHSFIFSNGRFGTAYTEILTQEKWMTQAETNTRLQQRELKLISTKTQDDQFNMNRLIFLC